MNIFVPLRQDCAIATEFSGNQEQFIRQNSTTEGISFVDNADDADLVIVFESWSIRFADYADILEDCRFIGRYLDKIIAINWDDVGRGFLPGCYVSLNPRNFDSDLHRACPYPGQYTTNFPELVQKIKKTESNTLISFRGNFNSNRIRKEIYDRLGGFINGKISDVSQIFRSHSENQRIEYVEEVLNSAFVLCPRGVSPATYRLFEVMELGRCPIIISDDWIEIPHIDWSSCSIRVDESRIEDIPMIASARLNDAEVLGRNARKVWEENFATDARQKSLLRLACELHQQKSWTPSTLRARWRSRAFLRSNEWLFSQRLRRAMRRVIT